MTGRARWSDRQSLDILLLPVGLLVALAVGVLAPGPGAAAGDLAVGPVDATAASVMLIFVISGFNIHGADVETSGFGRAVASVLVVNLVLAPVVVAGMLWLLPIGVAMALGLSVMGAVPTTLSSAAVTAGVAGGDRAWAAALTVVCVSVGALTAPLVASTLLQADTTIPPGPLLVRVIAIVAVPLAVGFLAARISGYTLASWWRLVPSLAVITLLWITVSESADSLRGFSLQKLAAIAGAVLLVHAVQLLAAWGAARRFDRPQGYSVLFVAAQKTLPLALSLLVAITALVPELESAAGEAVVVCVLWHLLQLVADSALAARMARSAG